MMVGQTRNRQQWSAFEKDVLWKIQHDPNMRDKTWPDKAKYFNDIVREALPQAPKRTDAAVYLAWKAMKTAMERMTYNPDGGLLVSELRIMADSFTYRKQLAGAEQSQLQTSSQNFTQPVQVAGYVGAAGTMSQDPTAGANSMYWQMNDNANLWLAQMELGTRLENGWGVSQAPGGMEF